MRTIFIYSLFVIIHLSASQSFAGSSSGSGGFAFTLSKKHLKYSIEWALKFLKKLDQSCVNKEMSKHGAGKVDFNLLSKIIKTTRFNYMDERFRKNKNGELEPLAFDFGTDENGPYIEALKMFFVGFMMGSNSDMHRNLTMRFLFHEASHHFGYSEEQATHFGIFLSQNVYLHSCLAN